jgi:nicotinate-nucleotide pyrophosphorylase (carboxylating)
MTIDEIIGNALEEDIGAGDVTTEATVDASLVAAGEFKAKAGGVVSGLGIATRVFESLDEHVVSSWNVTEGDRVEPGTIVGTVVGPARAILTGERTALNILQRMSGISTATSRMVEAVAGTDAVILDTRKTAPGLRILDKAAVVAGGGANHRAGLFDMVLIKDNHIVAAGGVSKAIIGARKRIGHRSEQEIEIEVETRTLDEVEQVVAHFKATGDPDRILLDNMVRRSENGSVDTAILEQAVRMVGGRMETEASGNVTEETVAAIAATGVDFISAGILTHSVVALDISLELKIKV